mgnify:FL=1
MFIGKKTKQRMAVWVVCTLSAGGSLYMGAQTAHAADVTGQNVVVNTAPGASPFAPIRLDPPTTGNVHNNKLTIDGITWAGQIFGALNMTATGSATDNELVLQGNAAITGIVTGGYTAGTGTATGNTITLSGLNGMALTHLYGGFSTGGSDDVTGNTLRVTARNNSAASLNKFEKMNFVLGTGIHSGDTMLQVQNNSTQSFDWSKVTVENGATWAASAPGSQRVRLFEGGNALTLQNYAVSGQTSGDYEYGLTTDASGTGTVTATNIYFDSNRFHKANITVNSAPVGTMSLYGGRSIFGNAVTENTLTVNGVTWTGHVYGGVSESTTMKATGNEVILKGGSDIIGTVTGGFTTGSGVATGNTVTLSGLNGAGHTHLYGGHSASGDDTTGNTLKVTTSGNTAASINSFEKMNFVLGAGIHSGDTMLTVDTSSAQTLKWENIKADKMQAWTTALAAAGINNPMLTLYTGAALTLQNYAPTITRVGDYELRRRANVTSTGTVTATTMSMDGNRYQNATTPTVVGTTVHAGLSNYGSTTNHNTLTIGGGSYTEARAGYTNAAKGGARENTLTFTGGSITNGYGGYTTGVTASDAELAVKPAAKADAAGNIVNLSGGTVNTGGKVYGGYIAVNTGIPAPNNVSDGDASGNTVSITSGIFGANTEIYGGYTNGRGKAVSNTVNLGSAAGVFAAPTLSNTKIYGGGSSGHAHDAVTNNTLNINAANINVRGIANFDKIRANLKSTMPLGSTLLTIAGGATTGLDWAGVEANTGSLSLTPSTYNDRLFTLMHNNAGLNFVQGGKDTYAPIGAKERVQGDLEFVIDTDSHAAQARSVYLSGYQFQNNTGAAYTAADGTHSAAWGGRTAVGNTVTNNKLTVSGGSLTDAAYGGLVENHKRNASGALPTGDAVKNTVILSSGANAASVYGADVRTRAGSASENRAEISGGTVTGNVYGAALSADNASGSATQNIAKVSGGSIGGNVYGASVPKTSGTADVTQNTAEISGGSIGGSVYGGQNVGTGNADQNNVKLSGGSIAGSVYGGYAAGTGSAKDNSITITGGSIGHDIYGGYAAGGKTTGNTVNIGDGSHALSAGTSIAGTIYGGNGADVKDNTLNINAKGASAGSIAGFGSITYRLNGLLNGDTLLTLRQNTSIAYGTIQKLTAQNAAAWLGNDMERKVSLFAMTGGKTLTLGGYTTGSGMERTGDLEYGLRTDNDRSATTGTLDIAAYRWQNADVTVRTAMPEAFGGKSVYRTNGETKNNKLTLASGAVLTSAVAGDTQTEQGAATGSVLTVRSGARVTGTAIGAKARGGAVQKSSAVAEGGTIAQLIGGQSASGIADTNTAELRGGTVGSMIGGESQTGAAKGNAAAVRGGSVTSAAGGKAGAASEGNSVLMQGGTAANLVGGIGASSAKDGVRVRGGSVTSSIIGGTAAHGNAVQSTAVIEGGTVRGTVLGASASGKAEQNAVTLTGGDIRADIIGARAGGDAEANTITVNTNITGNVAGAAAGAKALKNVIDLGNITVRGNVTGGQGNVTNDNIIHLRKSTVTGVITGGTAASGTGNTLVVHPGASQMSSFTGVQNLHFYLDQTVDKTAPILSLTGSSQDLRGVKIGVGVIDGKIPALRVNDQLSLIKMAAGGTLMTDAAIKNTTTGMQGVSLHYDFSITRSTPGELTATVTKAALGEQTKSFVETRAGMSDFINHGADSLASGSMNAAQKEAAKSGGYALWAATDKSNMKAKTGSYIDTNGWSLGLGWARTQRAKAGAWTFGPFVEYGHGSYGSYLNDGTHGSGKISYIGGGLMAKYAQHSGLWVEGSVHGGRAKSDYTGSIYKGTVSSYDGSSSYYAAHLGLGKELRIRRGDQLDAYLRYFYSHQAGMNATLSSGEDYTFDSVNSHRLRLGLRYTHRDSPASHVYAGLAFEYEFDGEARASFQGYSTPSPSLKGASGMLEIGYRFAPKGAKVSYDFNMTGWQGRREGVSGSANVKWMF